MSYIKEWKTIWKKKREMIVLVLFIVYAFSKQNEWVIEFHESAIVSPEAFASTHGIMYDGPTEFNPNLHIFHVASSSSRDRVIHEMVRLELPAIKWAEEQVERKRYKRHGVIARHGVVLTDPMYNDQWHLHATNGIDSDSVILNGSGIIIGIVDDGLQHEHPEIKANYASRFSFNFNSGGSRDDPTPLNGQDGHGTSAAGVAIAVRNNGHCGRGIAYGAKVAGLRLIADPVSDLTESQALSKYFSIIDIYSNSWGPADTGQGLDAPGRLVRETLARYAGANIGRGGRGTIYVWASGNGRDRQDSCNYDGYANNPYVNAIGAVDYYGNQAWYSEGCAALMAVTPSSGSMKGIITADLLGSAGYTATECTATFGGTSSAAPLATGIIALMLQQRPELTWRDVKHVIAKGATRINPSDPSWTTNTAGYHHSNKFGFGLLKLPLLLSILSSHVLVPRTQKQYVLSKIRFSDYAFSGGGGVKSIVIDVSENPKQITFIESIMFIVALRHPKRGNVAISLTSPSGITSVLAEHRNDPNANYPDAGWSFSSVKHWGENVIVGNWTVTYDSNDGLGTLQWHRLGIFGY